MNDKESDLKKQLDELKKITEELRGVAENTDAAQCSNCRHYAALAYRTAEKYYEVLIRAELIEATWYKKGGIDCDKIECDAKEQNKALKKTIDTIKGQLSGIMGNNND